MTVEQRDWRGITAKVKARVRRRVATSEVDDVTQEALLRIVRGLGALKDSHALVGWLAAVVNGAIADHHRAQRPPAPVDAGLDDEPSVLSVAAPFVEPFLELVPEPYRQAIRLVDLAQARQTDVARRLGVPVPTLKSRVQRGRALLRAELERCCRFELDQTGVCDIAPHAQVQSRRPRALRRSS